MNSLIVEVNEDKYLIRYKVLKSVVSRKHTEYKNYMTIDSFQNQYVSSKVPVVTNRLELHPNSVVVYLYKILHVHYDMFWNTEPNLKGLNKSINEGYLEYLGRGLSKCSDKDKFDKNKGIRQAIANIKELNSSVFDVFLAHDINYKILNTKL